MISEHFQRRRYVKLSAERQELQEHILAWANANVRLYDTCELILNLAVNAVLVFENGEIETRREILNLVVWNCTLTSGILHNTCKKPFDILAKGSDSAIWQTIVDD